MLIESSGDVLNLVIAFCVLLFTFFSVWLIFYIAMIAKQGYQIIKEARDKMKKIESVITSLKDKFDSSATHLALVAEGIKKIVDIVKDRKSKKSSAKK